MGGDDLIFLGFHSGLCADRNPKAWVALLIYVEFDIEGKFFQSK